jgi:hypothetical protein
MSYQRKKTLGRYGTQLGQPSITSYTFPAAVGGINAIDSLMLMPPEDAIYTYNLMPSEYGMRLRQGYRQWATGCVVDPAVNNDVRTIIPFESNIQDQANNRIFGVTAEGIWDVTLFNTNVPVRKAAFAQTSDPAGYGVWAEFTGDAAGSGLRGHYLFYADGLNGIWQYEEATDLWAQPPSGLTGADWRYMPDGATNTAFPVDNVAFVMVFKQRIWVILEDEDDAWYLPVASIGGELTRFNFGSKMPHGGNLQGLFTWTVDSGIGVDDMMVAIGRGGDVIIYQGEDPEITPTGGTPWSTKGNWFIGQTPNSRRIAVDYGPDLYILSTYGLVSLNNLLRGEPLSGNMPSRKISRFLRADVKQGNSSPSWQMVINPSDGFLQIITPKPTSTPYIQYNMNTQTGAWGFWENVPIFSADSLGGDYIMGGADGVVYINSGTMDGTEIVADNEFQDVPNPAAPAPWTVPVALEFQCDGTQVAETEYQVDLVTALTQDTEYILSYRIKANPPVNLFQNVPTVPAGAEWSNPVPNSYLCSGAQVAETAYQVNLVFDLKAGEQYAVSFDVAYSGAGTYKLVAGADVIIAFSSGNGSYSASYTPIVNQSTMSIVGNVDFVGLVGNVEAVLYDGAGQHSVSIGTEAMNSPSSGSGLFTSTFTATATDTQMALVGDENFTGTFYEVSLRGATFIGSPINFRCLTSFQAPAGHSNFTRVGFVRTIGLVAGTASLTVKAVYDYNIQEYISPPLVVPILGENVWNSAVWDRDLWDFNLKGRSFTSGNLGIGRSFAIGMSGNSDTRINIIGWDVLFNVGGYL